MTSAASKQQRSGANRNGIDTFTAGDLEHLESTLRSQKQIGAYPHTVQRLLELANMPVSSAEQLVGTVGRRPKASKHFLTSAKSNATGDSAKAALVMLPSDLNAIACSQGLLLNCLRLVTKPGTQLFTIAELAAGLNSRFEEPFKKAWRTSLESDRLPRHVGVLRRRKIAYLFLIDQIAGYSSLSEAGRDNVTNHQPPHDDRGQFDLSVAESELSERVLSTFDRLDRETGGHNYVKLAALRDALPESTRQELDSVVHSLRRAGRITLDSADGRHARLNEAELAAGIVEGGQRLVYVARRHP
ncbi:MAG TPA: hypothetical protein VKP30_28065 [Polyangiaceae bacterium]|nr:hypothetical protein [Polyangiaceae bacterium]